MEDGLANAIRMKDIRDFTWSLSDGSISQEAIADYLPAGNGLTEVWCTPGYAICHFESILFATFFQRVGTVVGSGVADLQFGGEISMTSVSPRRTDRRVEEVEDLRQEQGQRQLQQGEGASGPTAEFNMKFDVQPTPQDSTSGSLSKHVQLSLWYMVLVAAATTSLSLLMS